MRLLAGVFLGLLASSGAQFVRSYQNCMVLGFSDGVQLSWNISGSQIYFGMEGNFPNGYLGVGISRNVAAPEPLNSDIWAVSGPSDKTCSQMCLLDFYATSNDHAPQLDNTNNLQNVVYSRTATKIYAEWSRSLTASNSQDQSITPGTVQNVIWSGHPNDPIEGGDKIRGHNGANGWKGINSIDFGKTYTCTQPEPGGNSFQGNGFKADWTVDSTAGTITFTMTSDGTGWLSLGVGPNPGMAAMDCYLGAVVGGVATVQDAYSATSGSAPPADTQNDATGVTGSETGGKTTVTFTRKLDTGDAKDYVIKDQTVYLIYAFHTTSDDRSVKHTSYGVGRVNFLGKTGGGGGGNGTTGPIGAPIVPEGGASYKSDDGNLDFQWKIDPDAGTIDILAGVKTTGWFAIGIETDSTMEGSDYAVGWVQSDGAYMFDAYTADYNQPGTDVGKGGSSDITMTGSEEADGWTRISYRRPLKASDAFDSEITDSPMYLHYSLGDADGTYLDASSFLIQKHRIALVSTPINFYSGAVSGKGIADIFSPGGLLVLIVGFVFILFIAFRMINKLIKRLNDKHRGESGIKQVELTPQNIGQEETNSSPPMHDDDDDDYPVPSKNISPKPHVSRVINFFGGLHNVRIPKSHLYLGFVSGFALYIIINGLCFWLGLPLYHKAVGTLIAANAMLLTIPVSRNSVFSWISGMAFDRTIVYHRWLGRFTIFLTSLHFLLVLIKNRGDGLSDLLLERQNVYGIVGWAVTIGILATSIDPIRRKFYEIFHWLHFMFIAFFVFGCLHNPKFQPFAIAAAAIYLFDKVLRILWGATPKKTLKLQYKEGDLVQVVFPKGFLPKLFGMHRVGQYIFVNFPTISPLEWHPFSVSSGPNETTMEIHVKSLGDYTKKLVAAAKSGKDQLYIRADGPYGNHRINYRRFPTVVLVAGGIGVTPIMGLLKDCYQIGDIDPRMRQHRNAVDKVHVVWTVQNLEIYQWFADELAQCMARSGKGYPILDLQVYVTRPGPSDVISAPFIKGRPTIANIFGKIASEDTLPATVFTCGPSMMVDDCWDAVTKLRLKGKTFHFHHETFEF